VKWDCLASLCVVAFTATAPAVADTNALAPVLIASNLLEQTVVARIGQEIHVRLVGSRSQTGWEVAWHEGRELKSIAPGLAGGLSRCATEFTPDAASSDPSVGVYLFKYQAVRIGLSYLGFWYLYPGGPKPIKRNATEERGRFTFHVKVVDTNWTAEAEEALRVETLALARRTAAWFARANGFTAAHIRALDDEPARTREIKLENGNLAYRFLFLSEGADDQPYIHITVDKVTRQTAVDARPPESDDDGPPKRGGPRR
jgi:hypothetical protein